MNEILLNIVISIATSITVSHVYFILQRCGDEIGLKFMKKSPEGILFLKNEILTFGFVKNNRQFGYYKIDASQENFRSKITQSDYESEKLTEQKFEK